MFGQIVLDKIEEDWQPYVFLIPFPLDWPSEQRPLFDIPLIKVAFLYPFSCFSLASILSNFAQVVQCTKHSLFIAFSHLFVPTCREEQHDVIAIGDWNQKLSFYQLSGKQVESHTELRQQIANCMLNSLDSVQYLIMFSFSFSFSFSYIYILGSVQWRNYKVYFSYNCRVFMQNPWPPRYRCNALPIGDFRVSFRLCFKARPSAKPFIWKLVLFTCKWTKMCMWIKLCFAPGLALKQTQNATRKSPFELWSLVGSRSSVISIYTHYMIITVPLYYIL